MLAAFYRTGLQVHSTQERASPTGAPQFVLPFLQQNQIIVDQYPSCVLIQ